MYHECRVQLAVPIQATLSAENVLSLTRGWWPRVDAMPPVELRQGLSIALDDTMDYVYISTAGNIVVSKELLLYGINPATGEISELIDVIAWRNGSTWNVKRLIGGE